MGKELEVLILKKEYVKSYRIPPRAWLASQKLLNSVPGFSSSLLCVTKDLDLVLSALYDYFFIDSEINQREAIAI